MRHIKTSIIIPVLNEKKINRFLSDLNRSLLPKSKGNVEIIIVDGDPTGSTIRLINEPAIKIISPKGRACQQNKGAKFASGTILLFLHADTTLPTDFISLIRNAVSSGYSGGAFDLHLDSPHPLLKLTTRIASLRCRITGIPYGDQGIFITRSLFEKIGGFPEIPLMEDIALMLKIKKSRKRFTILQEKAITSPRMWYQKGILFTMVRNPLLASLYYLGVPPKVLSKFYY